MSARNLPQTLLHTSIGRPRVLVPYKFLSLRLNPSEVRTYISLLPPHTRGAVAFKNCPQRRFHTYQRAMSRPEDHQPLKNPPKVPRAPIPSSSVLVVSPSNQILLLHRVRTSSAFPSAHVFPGGALSAEHDGEIPAVDSLARHEDGRAYRLSAIRETFEESGILLAKNKTTGRLFTEIGDKEREEGRKAVHGGKVMFLDWLEKVGAAPDTDALIPLTRWITPNNVPKRFTTQMYLYFLPLPSSPSSSPSSPLPPSTTAAPHNLLDPDETIIPTPTHDGGIEHTAARFLPAAKWLALARAARILLFPPQFFLLHLLAPYLARSSTSPTSPLPPPAELQAERDALLAFLRTPATNDGEVEVLRREEVLGKGVKL
ncbi:hypothetical protein BU16DRAFT_104114 [Lophium mytilinum]|uniref:Nudix hydrolase domain-containing protein n=1 Tax=Lophium mytilinum TaxID=390894 RepID=A0A6A6QJA9_9PEZI|nr:hypothetical protein BU16DRAFT_104114 [Lophium mytilinum]